MFRSARVSFLKVDEAKGEVSFDATLDEAQELEKAYRLYLAGDIDSYRLPERYAGGFEGMVQQLERRKPALRFFKGRSSARSLLAWRCRMVMARTSSTTKSPLMRS